MGAEPHNLHPSVADMTDDDIDAIINDIRVRRMKPYAAYVEAMKQRQVTEQANVRKALDQQIRLMKADLASLDKKLETATARAVKLRALRLQFGGES